ncbi:hypothetical protein F5882DRAFT_22599 [Hyaloscypha sp. PMI_1271]|nr:hypothetical protein F5882DRAFT_22599 [Hyaloscypha sp. PMI_1271]
MRFPMSKRIRPLPLQSFSLLALVAKLISMYRLASLEDFSQRATAITIPDLDINLQFSKRLKLHYLFACAEGQIDVDLNYKPHKMTAYKRFMLLSVLAIPALGDILMLTMNNLKHRREN